MSTEKEALSLTLEYITRKDEYTTNAAMIFFRKNGENCTEYKTIIRVLAQNKEPSDVRLLSHGLKEGQKEGFLRL